MNTTPLPQLTPAQMRERLEQIYVEIMDHRDSQPHHKRYTADFRARYQVKIDRSYWLFKSNDKATSAFIDYCEEAFPNSVLDNHEIEQLVSYHAIGIDAASARREMLR